MCCDNVISEQAEIYNLYCNRSREPGRTCLHVLNKLTNVDLSYRHVLYIYKEKEQTDLQEGRKRINFKNDII